MIRRECSANPSSCQARPYSKIKTFGGQITFTPRKFELLDTKCQAAVDANRFIIMTVYISARIMLKNIWKKSLFGWVFSFLFICISLTTRDVFASTNYFKYWHIALHLFLLLNFFKELDALRAGKKKRTRNWFQKAWNQTACRSSNSRFWT